MYDALPLSTCWLPLSLQFSVPSFSSQWWSRLCCHSPDGPPWLPCMMLSLSQPPGSLFPYSSLSSLVQVSGGVGSVAFSSWPTLDTMYDALPLSTSRLPLYCSLSPLIQASCRVSSVAILLLAHLGYHIRRSRSLNLQDPSFSIVLCLLFFKPLVESALLPFSCWPTSAIMYDSHALSTSRLPLSP